MKKVWLLLLIFAVACSENSTNPTDGEVKLSKTQTDWLFPSTIGNKWVYRVTNDWLLDKYGVGQYNATLNITSFLGSLEWINSGRDGKADTYEITVLGLPEFDEKRENIIGFNGVSKEIIRGDSKNFYHIARQFEEPITPSICIDLEYENHLSKYKFTGTEDVVIDGKVYKNCYKYESKYINQEISPLHTEVWIIYLKKGVGLVKKDSYTLINETIYERVVTELVSYTIK